MVLREGNLPVTCGFPSHLIKRFQVMASSSVVTPVDTLIHMHSIQSTRKYTIYNSCVFFGCLFQVLIAFWLGYLFEQTVDQRGIAHVFVGTNHCTHGWLTVLFTNYIRNKYTDVYSIYFIPWKYTHLKSEIVLAVFVLFHFKHLTDKILCHNITVW